MDELLKQILTMYQEINTEMIKLLPIDPKFLVLETDSKLEQQKDAKIKTSLTKWLKVDGNKEKLIKLMNKYKELSTLRRDFLIKLKHLLSVITPPGEFFAELQLPIIAAQMEKLESPFLEKLVKNKAPLKFEQLIYLVDPLRMVLRDEESPAMVDLRDVWLTELATIPTFNGPLKNVLEKKPGASVVSDASQFPADKIGEYLGKIKTAESKEDIQTLRKELVEWFNEKNLFDQIMKYSSERDASDEKQRQEIQVLLKFLRKSGEFFGKDKSTLELNKKLDEIASHVLSSQVYKLAQSDARRQRFETEQKKSLMEFCGKEVKELTEYKPQELKDFLQELTEHLGYVGDYIEGAKLDLHALESMKSVGKAIQKLQRICSLIVKNTQSTLDKLDKDKPGYEQERKKLESMIRNYNDRIHQLGKAGGELRILVLDKGTKQTSPASESLLGKLGNKIKIPSFFSRPSLDDAEIKKGKEAKEASIATPEDMLAAGKVSDHISSAIDNVLTILSQEKGNDGIVHMLKGAKSKMAKCSTYHEIQSMNTDILKEVVDLKDTYFGAYLEKVEDVVDKLIFALEREALTSGSPKASPQSPSKSK